MSPYTICCFILIFLALTTQTHSFLTVRVEINPSINGTLPICSKTFVDDFQGNLTAIVLNATNQISSLSDFIIPSGLHLTYFDNTTAERRSLRSLAVYKNIDVCRACSSSGCALSCGIGVCKLCKNDRRLSLFSPSKSLKGSLLGDRMLAADWDQVGLQVTRYVTPIIQNYLLASSSGSLGCLGNPSLLDVNVTYLSDVVIDAALESALVSAFGGLPPKPTMAAMAAAPSKNACCSLSFASCINYCGTTQQQCSNCTDEQVVWLPQGPPSNTSCIPRWGTCTTNQNGCCSGLSCVGDQSWKGCLYVPPQQAALPPLAAPTAAPANASSGNVISGCCTRNFASCVTGCGVSQKECKECVDTTVAWLPAGAPTKSCIARWATCTQNVTSCCPGLTCTGNKWWKSCEFIP